MSSIESPAPDEVLELWHPIYLDTDMSMAFAAALAGGVALEHESVDHDSHESQAVRNLRGNLRLFDILTVGGGRERRETESGTSESRMVRHHTEASVFIALYDELRKTGRIAKPDVNGFRAGDIVSLELGPATAPLHRVVDQFIRLLDIADPQVASDDRSSSGNRQPNRQGGRTTPKSPQAAASADDIRPLLRALKDDLDRSGMTDVVVRREAGSSVILTLDNRVLTTQALEMLHTSTFTVVGKVTQVWPTSDDVVNLFRRSVLSMVPALSQMFMWSFLNLMVTLATNVDSGEMQRAAMTAAGLEVPEMPSEPSEIMIGDVNPLLPTLNGPAIQVLPLAICA